MQGTGVRAAVSTGLFFVYGSSPANATGGISDGVNFPTVTSVAVVDHQSLSAVSFVVAGFFLGETAAVVCPVAAPKASCAPCGVVGNLTATRLECAVAGAALPPGRYAFSVLHASTSDAATTVAVDGRGFARSMSVTAIAPHVMSAGGRGVVTVTGAWFGNDTAVSVGGLPCERITHVHAAAGGRSTLTCRAADRGLRTRWYADNYGAGPRVLHPQGLLAVTLSARSVTVTGSIAVSADVTPVIESVEPRVGQRKSLTITGRYFTAGLRVEVGGVRCAVTQSYDNEVVCALSALGPHGPAEVTLDARPYGLATFSRPYAGVFHFTLAVSAVTPVVGSVAGGQRVTVTGEGFHSGVNVSVVGLPCVLESVAVSQIVCVTTSRSVFGTEAGPVVVLDANGEASCCSFTYDAAQTPIFESFSPTTSVGGRISIVGQNFETDNSKFEVTFAGVASPDTVAISKLAIFSVIPSVPALVVVPRMRVHALGYAWAAATLPALQLLPSVKRLRPVASSYGGGQLVTIFGNSFWTEQMSADVAVTVCGRPCAFVSATLTTVVCRTPDVLTAESIAKWPSAVLAGNLQFEAPAAPAVLNASLVSYAERGNGAPIDLLAPLHTSFVLRALHFYVTNADDATSATVEASADGVSWQTVVAAVAVRQGWQVVPLGSASTQWIAVRFALTAARDPAAVHRVASAVLRGAEASRGATGTCPVNIRIKVPQAAASQSCESADGSSCASILYATATTMEVSGVSGGPFDDDAYGQAVEISGLGFSNDQSLISVLLPPNKACAVTTARNTRVACTVQLRGLSSLTNHSFGFAADSIAVVHQTNGAAVDLTKTTAAPRGADLVRGTPWSDAATWVALGLTPPAEDAVVVVPANATLLLDVTPPRLAALVVEGTLFVRDGAEHLRLTCAVIVVRGGGALLVGTSAAPLTKFSIRMNDTYAPRCELGPATCAAWDAAVGSAVTEYGAGSVVVLDGALEMHGRRSNAVARHVLAEAAVKGSATLQVSGAVSWAAGDAIALTSVTGAADDDWYEEHVVSATSANDNGNTTVTLRDAVRSNLPAHSRQTALGAEVYLGPTEIAHLTRAITIQPADIDVAAAALRGCSVVVAGSNRSSGSVLLNGVAFDACGSADRPRAALSFDAAGDVAGSYVQYCTFRRSFGGAISIAATSNLAVSHNVVHRTVGHGIAVTGGSTDVTMVGNLAAHAAGADGDDAACFYTTHPTVHLTDNVAAACGFAGFWFDVRTERGTCGTTAALGTNARNGAHNCRFGLIATAHEPSGGATACTAPDVAPSVITANVDELRVWYNVVGVALHRVSSYEFTALSATDNAFAAVVLRYCADVRLAAATIALDYVAVSSTSATLSRSLTPASSSSSILSERLHPTAARLGAAQLAELSLVTPIGFLTLDSSVAASALTIDLVDTIAIVVLGSWTLGAALLPPWDAALPPTAALRSRVLRVDLALLHASTPLLRVVGKPQRLVLAVPVAHLVRFPANYSAGAYLFVGGAAHLSPVAQCQPSIGNVLPTLGVSGLLCDASLPGLAEVRLVVSAASSAGEAATLQSGAVRGGQLHNTTLQMVQDAAGDSIAMFVVPTRSLTTQWSLQLPSSLPWSKLVISAHTLLSASAASAQPFAQVGVVVNTAATPDVSVSSPDGTPAPQLLWISRDEARLTAFATLGGTESSSAATALLRASATHCSATVSRACRSPTAGFAGNAARAQATAPSSAWSSLWATATTSTDVTVAAGQSVAVDTSIAVRTLFIAGTLSLAAATCTSNLTIRAHRIVVTGALTLGTAEAPLACNLRIQLGGSSADVALTPSTVVTAGELYVAPNATLQVVGRMGGVRTWGGVEASGSSETVIKLPLQVRDSVGTVTAAGTTAWAQAQHLRVASSSTAALTGSVSGNIAHPTILSVTETVAASGVTELKANVAKPWTGAAAAMGAAQSGVATAHFAFSTRFVTFSGGASPCIVQATAARTVLLSGLAFDGCGSSTRPALTFSAGTNGTAALLGCVFSSSLGTAVAAVGGAEIAVIHDNVVFTAVNRNGIESTTAAINITDNLVIGEAGEATALYTAAQSCAFKLPLGVALLDGNVAAASRRGDGFCFTAGASATSQCAAFRNTAYGHITGVVISGVLQQVPPCVALVSSFRNRFAGVVSRVAVKLSQWAVQDNPLGIVLLSPAGSSVELSAIAGSVGAVGEALACEAVRFDCFTELAAGDRSTWCLQSHDVGVRITPVAANVCARMSSPPAFGRVNFDTVTVTHLGQPTCRKSYGFGVADAADAALPAMRLDAVTFDETTATATHRFYAPAANSAQWRSGAGAAKCPAGHSDDECDPVVQFALRVNGSATGWYTSARMSDPTKQCRQAEETAALSVCPVAAFASTAMLTIRGFDRVWPLAHVRARHDGLDAAPQPALMEHFVTADCDVDHSAPSSQAQLLLPATAVPLHISMYVVDRHLQFTLGDCASDAQRLLNVELGEIHDVEVWDLQRATAFRRVTTPVTSSSEPQHGVFHRSGGLQSVGVNNINFEDASVLSLALRCGDHIAVHVLPRASLLLRLRLPFANAQRATPLLLAQFSGFFNISEVRLTLNKLRPDPTSSQQDVLCSLGVGMDSAIAAVFNATAMALRLNGQIVSLAKGTNATQLGDRLMAPVEILGYELVTLRNERPASEEAMSLIPISAFAFAFLVAALLTVLLALLAAIKVYEMSRREKALESPIVAGAALPDVNLPQLRSTNATTSHATRRMLLFAQLCVYRPVGAGNAKSLEDETCLMSQSTAWCRMSRLPLHAAAETLVPAPDM
jgi:hypothetical protein